MLSSGLDTGLQSFYHSFIALSMMNDDTLFEVSPEIHCSSVKSLLLLWKPRSWLSQFKNFTIVKLKIE